MYVNGILRHSYSVSKKIGVNNQEVLLGRHGNPAYPYWFNGIMDEVRIYNRALNLMEIDSICSQSNPQQTSIKEKNGMSQLPIITNPVLSNLELGLEHRDWGGKLSIVDMTGRTLINIERLNEPKIFVGHLASGFYMVNYQLGEKFMSVKFIKQ
jgi:hypothetical protein